MPLIIGALARALSEKPKPPVQDASTQTNLTWTQIDSMGQKIQKFHQNWKASLQQSQLKDKVNQALSFRLSVLQKKLTDLAAEEKFKDENEDNLNQEVVKLTNSAISSPKDLDTGLKTLEKLFAQPKYQEDQRTIEKEWFTSQLSKLAKIKSLVHSHQLLSSQRELETTALKKQLTENQKQWETTKNQLQIEQKYLLAQVEEERETLIQAHQKALKQRDQEVANLKKTIDDLKLTSGTAQTNLEKRVNELEGIEKKQKDLLKEYLQTTFSLGLKVTSQEQEITRQKEKITFLESDRQGLELTNDSLWEQIKKDASQQEELGKQIKLNSAVIYELEEKLNQAQKDLTTLQQEKQAKENELNQTIFNLQQEIKSLKNLSEKDKASLSSEVNQLRQELLVAREQISLLKAQVKSIAELERLVKVQAARSLEAEEELKKQIKEQVSQNENQRQQIKNLESQVDQSVITDPGEKEFFTETFSLTDQFASLFVSSEATLTSPTEPTKWQEFRQWYTTKFKSLPRGGDNLTTGFLPNPHWKYPQVWLQTSQWLTNLYQAIKNLNSARHEIKQQKVQESNLHKEINQLKTTAEKSKLGGQQLQSQITNLQQTIQQHERTIKELQAIILELEDKLRQKNSTYEALQRNYQQTQAQLQQQINQLESQASADRQTISNLENNLQTLQNKFRDVEDLLNTSQQEKEAMLVEKERLLNEKNSLADKIADLEREAEAKERELKLRDDQMVQHEDSLNSLRELLANAEIRLQEGELTTEEKTILGEVRILLQEINLARAGNVEDNITRIINRNQSIVQAFTGNPNKYMHLSGLLSTHFATPDNFAKNIIELIRELEETRGGLEVHRREAIEKGEECAGLIEERGRMMGLLGIHRQNMVWMSDGAVDFTQGINQQQFFNEMPNLKVFFQSFDEDKKVMVPDVPIYLKNSLRMISLFGEPNSANLDIIIDSVHQDKSKRDHGGELGDTFVDDHLFEKDNLNIDNYRRLWHITPETAHYKQGGSNMVFEDSYYRAYKLPAASFHHPDIRQSLQDNKQIIHLDNRKVRYSDFDQGRSDTVLYDPQSEGGNKIVYYKIETLEKALFLKVGFFHPIARLPQDVVYWPNYLPEDHNKPCFDVDCDSQFSTFGLNPKIKKITFKFASFPHYLQSYNQSGGFKKWNETNDWYQGGTTQPDFRLLPWNSSPEKEKLAESYNKPLIPGFGNYISKFKGFIEPGYGWLTSRGNMANITNKLKGFDKRSLRICWKIEPKPIFNLPKIGLNIISYSLDVDNANKIWLKVEDTYYNNQPIKYIVFFKEKAKYFNDLWKNNLDPKEKKVILTFGNATCNLSLGDSLSNDVWQRYGLEKGDFLNIDSGNEDIYFEPYRRTVWMCTSCNNGLLDSEVVEKEFNCMRSGDGIASVKKNRMCLICGEVVSCQFGGKCFPVGTSIQQITGDIIARFKANPREITFYWLSYYHWEENAINSKFVINIADKNFGIIDYGQQKGSTHKIILVGESIWDGRYGRTMKELFENFAQDNKKDLKITLIGTSKFIWSRNQQGYTSTDIAVNGDFSVAPI